ncbi:MAG: hypothetical protein ACLQOO_32915 [Terriglobia bacterium]
MMNKERPFFVHGSRGGAGQGKALEPLPKGTGVIQVLVTLQ